jgi:HlyD family secretion protein
MTRFFTKKRIIWGIIILVVLGIIGFLIFGPKKGNDQVLTETVKQQDLKQTVLATGQVTSATDLDLSFKGSGIIRRVSVKVGQEVKGGDILANLDQRDQSAALTSARGTLASAQANYQKVLDGASSEEVQVAQAAVNAAQVTLDNAKKALTDTKKQQEVLVANARSALYNSGLAAVPATNNITTATATVSGTYGGTESGSYTVRIYRDGTGIQLFGLESGSGDASSLAPMKLGNKGLFIQFSSGRLYDNDTWTIEIPNTRSTTYVTNLNAYSAALETQRAALTSGENAIAAAQSSYDQAVASLNLKKAQARPADVAAARAQILSAQGQVEAAAAALENTVIRAPTNGTVTAVNIKVGEQATPTITAMVLQDVGSLHIEANVSEANISQIKVGQSVELTFDSLGPDRKFNGTIQQIDPASTVVSGVVNYKVTAGIDKVEEVKPGMTANMTILTGEKKAVLAVPQRSVLSKDGKKIVRIVTDTKKKTYTEVEVSTGIDADGGLVEIVGGLQANQEIVTFINKK